MLETPVKFVSSEEAEACDFVVCICAADDTGFFADNLRGSCCDCGATVVFRPTTPKKPPRICMGCAIDRRRGDQA